MGIFDNPTPKDEAVYAQEAAMIDASELIADALDRSDMTKAQLARTLGISRSEVTARLAGERNITVRKLAATLHSLGMRLELSAVPAKTKEQPTGQDPWATFRGTVVAHEHATTSRSPNQKPIPVGAWKGDSK